jgi:ABC-type multidrug transport system ATPase subunit
MTEPLVELREVDFSVHHGAIVRNVSLRIEEGEAAALVGPSGGGKSTVLKLAAGILVPTRGAVYFRGKNISAMSRAQDLAFRKEGAVVFQDSALWANQSLYQTLELPLRIHYPRMGPEEREKRIREAAGEAGYKRDLDVRPDMLSMGEQKLIAFARAMLCWPRLLYLDEWTESLDDAAAQRLLGMVRRHHGGGGTVIFVSHDLRLIESLAQRVIIITQGRISMDLRGSALSHDAIAACLLEDGTDAV